MLKNKEIKMNTISEVKRKEIDIIKGTAIFLMFWGHAIQCCSLGEFDFFEDAVFKFIYGFHMPLFALISGYLFWYSYQKRNMLDLWEHRIKSLLFPIFIGGIILYITTTGISSLLRGAFAIQWMGHG